MLESINDLYQLEFVYLSRIGFTFLSSMVSLWKVRRWGRWRGGGWWQSSYIFWISSASSWQCWEHQFPIAHGLQHLPPTSYNKRVLFFFNQVDATLRIYDMRTSDKKKLDIYLRTFNREKKIYYVIVHLFFIHKREDLLFQLKLHGTPIYCSCCYF